jgi:hypothetical protein
VREIVASGTNWVVSTIAGQALNFGFTDGTNGDAQFNYPYGITVDGTGRPYVADFGNNAIRGIDAYGSNWVVSTIAGNSSAIGNVDGPGRLATFNEPNSICVDHFGALYVTDQSNDTIRKLTGSGTNWATSTIGGLALQAGAADGLGNVARFRHPWGIAAGPEGEVYVADYGNHTIRKGVFIPSLRIMLSLQRIFLLWPSTAFDYVPERSFILNPGAVWSPLTNAPATNGPNLVIADQIINGPVFYRLRKP